jgi:hypothetical protein
LQAIHHANKMDAEKILRKDIKREIITKRLGSGTLLALENPAIVRVVSSVAYGPNSEKVHDMSSSIKLVQELAQLESEMRQIEAVRSVGIVAVAIELALLQCSPAIAFACTLAL